MANPIATFETTQGAENWAAKRWLAPPKHSKTIVSYCVCVVFVSCCVPKWKINASACCNSWSLSGGDHAEVVVVVRRYPLRVYPCMYLPIYMYIYIHTYTEHPPFCWVELELFRLHMISIYLNFGDTRCDQV